MAVDGLLIDIDGVLTVSWEPIPGSVAAFDRLRRSGVPFRLITNTTTRTRAGIAEALAGAGFEVDVDHILTAPAATASYLRRSHPGARFFAAALDSLGVDPGRAAMIGDDVENDVLGAQRAGIFGVLVRTGKYRPDAVESASGDPDRIVADFAEAIDDLVG